MELDADELHLGIGASTRVLSEVIWRLLGMGFLSRLFGKGDSEAVVRAETRRPVSLLCYEKALLWVFLFIC